MAVNTLRKEERLKRKKQIDTLFNSGRSFYLKPYKVFWYLAEDDEAYPAQVLIGASRKALKKAVDRNRAKRQVKEIYRHRKARLYDFLKGIHKHAYLGIIYTNHTLLDFQDAERKINQVIDRLLEEFEKHPDL